MKGITISKKEALARLSDEPEVEYRIEKWKNDGITLVASAPRSWAIERIEKALLIYESGQMAQEIDFGIYIDATFKEGDSDELQLVYIFLKTKPIYRLTEQQLEDSIRRGCGADLFSS